MYIPALTLDDLLHHVFERLLKGRNRPVPSRGETTELIGIVLKLANPRARLSRSEIKGTVFSCLGEFLWYMAKSNSLRFIKYYAQEYTKDSDDGRTLYGAYGPRLFDMRGHDQVANVITLLKRNPATRRAVIQLFNAEDIAQHHKEIPCTCTLQFLVRRRQVHLFVSMRSNDAFLGLPHDVFAFTMLQEIIARSLDIDVGIYKHAVGSLHLYDRHRERAAQYLSEGWHSTMPMPPMPAADPWPAIRTLIKAERAIRLYGSTNVRALNLSPYWEDLVRLLQVFHSFKKNKSTNIQRLKRAMSVPLYDPYIDMKRLTAQARAAAEKPKQPLLI